MHSYLDLLGLSDSELAQIDPLVQNLLVAKSIPALVHREIEPLQRQVDRWADHFRRWLPQAEREYHNRPERWENNVYLFRLGMLCQFLVQNVKIAYKESLRELKKVAYTDANDLFLTGIIDTRRGTCGTMAELYLAMGWRMGWPVTLTKIWWHTMLRYDDGVTVLNLEVTEADRGGFACLSDDDMIERDKIDPTHIASGSDLCTLTPRQVLGIFIGSRGRHTWDTVQVTRARKDFELALTLYPQSRVYRHMVEECRLVDGGGWKVIQCMEPPTPEQQRMDKMLDSNRVTFGLGFSAQKMRDDFEQTLALLSLPAQEARGFKSGQSNLYDFVGNAPTDGTDPTGLQLFIRASDQEIQGGIVTEIAENTTIGLWPLAIIRKRGVSHPFGGQREFLYDGIWVVKIPQQGDGHPGKGREEAERVFKTLNNKDTLLYQIYNALLTPGVNTILGHTADGGWGWAECTVGSLSPNEKYMSGLPYESPYPARKVNINVCFLPGSDPGKLLFKKDLEYANKVYAQAGISFRVNETRDLTDRAVWGDLDGTVDKNQNINIRERGGDASGAVEFLARNCGKRGEINIFYAKDIGEGEGACGFTFYAERYPKMNPSCFITNLGAKDLRTLAHEIGHLFLGGKEDWTDVNNLMAQTNNPPSPPASYVDILTERSAKEFAQVISQRITNNHDGVFSNPSILQGLVSGGTLSGKKSQKMEHQMKTITSQNVRLALLSVASIFIWGSLNGCGSDDPNKPPDKVLPVEFDGARIVWGDLLAAMKSKDLKKIESLTTANGMKSLNERVPKDKDRLQFFQWLGTKWSQGKMNWQAAEAEPGLEPRDGRLYGLMDYNGNSLVEFVKTPQGWRFEGGGRPGM